MEGVVYSVGLRRLNTKNRQASARNAVARIMIIRCGQTSIPSKDGAIREDVLNTAVSFGFIFLPVYFNRVGIVITSYYTTKLHMFTPCVQLYES
ncbi:hypothetical protein D3C73_1343580 [compost metagenome]